MWADIIYQGEIDAARTWIYVLGSAAAVAVFGVVMVLWSWVYGALYGVCTFALGLWIADRRSLRMWEELDSLSWPERKVKASEIVRRKRNSAG